MIYSNNLFDNKNVWLEFFIMKKIWIVDDYLPMLDCMRIILELHHYEVEIKQNAEFIVDNQIQPDLLLIDYHIPGIDNYSIFEQVKKSSSFQNIPIILMSGLTKMAWFT